MANLNIPFLALQQESAKFLIDPASSLIVARDPFSQKSHTQTLVIADQKTGSFAMCHFETILCQKLLKPNKFLVTVIPKLLCVPEIFPKSEFSDHSQRYILVGSCVVQSPAPSILQTSETLLVTAHSLMGQPGGELRVWSFDDGRCIITSPRDLLQGLIPCRLFSPKEKDLPGILILICESQVILIISVYTMRVISRIQGTFEAVRSVQFSKIHDTFSLHIIDQKGTIFEFRNPFASPNDINCPIKQKMRDIRRVRAKAAQAFKQQSNLLLHLSRDTETVDEDSGKILQMEEFKIVKATGESSQEDKARGVQRRILCFERREDDWWLVVYQDRIEMVLFGGVLEPDVILQYKSSSKQDDGFDFRKQKVCEKEERDVWIVFAKAITVERKRLLLILNSDFLLIVFDISQFKPQKVIQVDLFRQSHIFDLVSKHVDPLYGLSLMQSQQELMEKKLEVIKSLISNQLKAHTNTRMINLHPDSLLLYTFLSFPSKERTQCMVTWSLESLLCSWNASSKIPLHLNEVDIFNQGTTIGPTVDSFCIINLNQTVLRKYFTRHQHSYFYADEIITQQAFYVSLDHPSLIIGTNYGRIFIIQVFQDIEGRPYPIIVIDSHSGSPITAIYIGYSTPRRIKRQDTVVRAGLEDKGHSQLLANSLNTESGGHLIASSKDGTISVTNLDSGQIIRILANFQTVASENNGGRVEGFMRERQSRHRLRRSHSFSNDFQTRDFFNLVKASPFKVFKGISLGPVSRIVEVQILQQIQIERQKYLSQSTHQDHVSKEPSSIVVSQSLSNSTPLKSQTSEGNKDQKQEQIKKVDKRGPVTHQYAQHLNLNSLIDPSGTNQLSPLLSDFIPFKASYACIDKLTNQVIILSINFNDCDLMKCGGLDSEPIGVYEDVVQSLIHIVTAKELNVYTFSKRTKRFVRRSGYAFAQSLVQMNQTIATLLDRQQHFQTQHRVFEGNEAEQTFDPYSFDQHCSAKSKISGHKHQSHSGAINGGYHQVLDYLSLSLSLPLYFHPHRVFSQKYTKSIDEYLNRRSLLVGVSQSVNWKDQKQVKEGLSYFIKCQFAWNDRYKSDFCQDFFNSLGAVTPLITDNNNSQLTLLIANTSDLIHFFKNRLRALSDSVNSQTTQEQGETKGDQIPGNKEKVPSSDHINQLLSTTVSEYLHLNKWPTRLLGLVHPFNLGTNLDENLEQFLGLNVPYLDLRIGVQGTGQSFSFVVEREDREHYNLRLGDPLTGVGRTSVGNQQVQLKLINQARVSSCLRNSQSSHLNDQVRAYMEQSSQLSQSNFVNCEFWRASSYLNTLMSQFFLSTLVSMVEHVQQDITLLMRDWLDVIQVVTAVPLNQSIIRLLQIKDPLFQKILAEQENSKINNSKPLSLSALSQIILRRDPTLSSCARDVLMKPLLSSGSSIDLIKQEINEWQDLIIDTYLKLKEDSSLRHTYIGNTITQQPSHIGEADKRDAPQHRVGGSFPQGQVGGDSNQTVGGQVKMSSEEQKTSGGSSRHTDTHERSINHFFGELEIRGLVNLSYYALASQDGPEHLKVDVDIQNRLCKCTVILTREAMTQFTANSKEHQNLLTILMQLLQAQMRSQVPTFKTKVIKDDVIKILLLIYDFYKKQLKDERFLTRVVADNFHLILPKNPELYLKLTAAKTLLEIGTYFREDFLLLIDEQATTLKDGPDYQRNVLDVLRYFISGSRDGLEPYLIHIVQTLLRCLDPNDEQLRRNSTQTISYILSTLVKTFPMVAFHHKTQKLAVGTISGPIAIYDVKTSSKWKILEGHSKDVTCVEFDAKGDQLASYSMSDQTLRLWKVVNAGFFSTIMGGTGNSVKEIQLPAIRLNQDQIQQMQRKSMTTSLQGSSLNKSQRVSERQVCKSELARLCKIVFTNNDKSLLLRREDGSQKEHRLGK